MPQTNIRGSQILNATVQRQDLDTSTVGQAVVTKLVQGSGITLSSTGADSGTGDVTVTSPDVVSTDAGNIATLGTDNHILVPQSQIWSVRLRSFNATGNPTFEVTQRNCGAQILNPAGGTFIEDRWQGSDSGLTGNFQVISQSPPVLVPGTSFAISRSCIRISTGAVKASLAAGDVFFMQTLIEGPMFRELMSDVHSISVLARSSVANVKLGLSLRDATAARSLTKLCTLGAANTWSLVTLPNLPIWPSAVTFSPNPGVNAHILSFCWAAGTTNTSPANDTWQTGNFVGAVGQDNFFANASGSNVDLAFIQHEPGALCTTPIDCPFLENLTACCRYFQKSYDYATKPGTVIANGQIQTIATAGGYPNTAQVLFNPRMAKVPTCTAYSPNNGASPQVYDATLPGNRVVNTGGWGAGETGFSGFGLNSTNGGIAQYNFHYTADTGW